MQRNDSTLDPQTRAILDALANQVRQTRAAYQKGMPGVTYEDMARAAERLLRMRAAVERAQGRTVVSKPTKKAIATILRADTF